MQVEAQTPGQEIPVISLVLAQPRPDPQSVLEAHRRPSVPSRQENPEALARVRPRSVGRPSARVSIRAACWPLGPSTTGTLAWMPVIVSFDTCWRTASAPAG